MKSFKPAPKTYTKKPLSTWRQINALVSCFYIDPIDDLYFRKCCRTLTAI
jgi:hypothetical protein